MRSIEVRNESISGGISNKVAVEVPVLDCRPAEQLRSHEDGEDDYHKAGGHQGKAEWKNNLSSRDSGQTEPDPGDEFVGVVGAGDQGEEPGKGVHARARDVPLFVIVAQVHMATVHGHLLLRI